MAAQFTLIIKNVDVNLLRQQYQTLLHVRNSCALEPEEAQDLDGLVEFLEEAMVQNPVLFPMPESRSWTKS